ncbi:MAG TPA: hypothetical protein VIL12_01970, partial [Acidimicrobiia bacterium]
MGDEHFSSADPWGIPVEERTAEDTHPEERPEGPVVDELDAEAEPGAAVAGHEAEASPASTESVSEVDTPGHAGAKQGSPPVPSQEPVEWEREPEGHGSPPAKARGFSQMLAAALASIRGKEEEEGLGEDDSHAAADEGDVLEETPVWMIERAPDLEAIDQEETGQVIAQDQEPPFEPDEPTVAVQAVEGIEEASGEPAPESKSEDVDVEGLVAELEVEADVDVVREEPTEVAAEDFSDIFADQDVIELPEESPEVYRELEDLPPPVVAVSAASVAADQEEQVSEAEPTDVIPSADQLVVARPGIEWGSRWKETAQGWVENEEGRSTWRPIVTTASSLSQWDVDTYLGVVAGDGAAPTTQDPSSSIARARGDALQAMLDEAV